MTTISSIDSAIQKNIVDELEWDPEVEAAHISVEVEDGVVILSGTVKTYSDYKAAERAAFRVAGVRAIANEILVKQAGNAVRDDAALARAIADAFACNALIPDEIAIRVTEGGVTLSGTVRWEYQRNVAEKTARAIRGVLWVSNLIGVVQPAVAVAEIEDGIKQALVRNAVVDADCVHVSINDGHVTLTGMVQSWDERKEAEAAAWRSRGVTAITNAIAVRPAAPV